MPIHFYCLTIKNIFFQKKGGKFETEFSAFLNLNKFLEKGEIFLNSVLF